MLKAICEACGKRILAFCAASGKLTLLLWQTLRRLKDANWHEVVRQMALLGADSLPIVLMTILCTGMVFSVQTAKEFVRLGAASTVGGIVAIAMARELEAQRRESTQGRAPARLTVRSAEEFDF